MNDILNKAEDDVTIIIGEDFNDKELDKVREAISRGEIILSSRRLKIYEIKKGKLYSVLNRRKFVKYLK